MAHRYERVDHQSDDEDDLEVHNSRDLDAPRNPNDHIPIPSSPPPSFHSVFPESNQNQNQNALADSFESPSDDEGDDGDMRNVRSTHNANFGSESAPLVPQRPSGPSGIRRFFPSWGRPSHPRIMGGGQTDGVFSNISAKPQVGEKEEENPPSYEQAAADATPPYWETTILAPGLASDEVFIDGLPVGSVFAFLWNGLISMSFQLVGFLLTYLLHTTHAAKNGSRAGLGITLVQYGFMLRGEDGSVTPDGSSEPEPSDPNSYNVDETASEDSIGRNEWLSYILMVVGWFILIRAISDFLRARRTEQLVLASPDRGLGMAVVAEGESTERAV
ncbi:hypothetical protein EX30DRAFT_372477 [Ascodesmis nigricans]|uniref:Metal homeostatis protein bsd2 n=1 Tax=Ascodesmis nigricans TaxID=341454 RepID=A0A4S2MUM7_9PEZI|nr:hypothetical protein EX30DRAFT_372477 [Ascodesmis nigricans]